MTYGKKSEALAAAKAAGLPLSQVILVQAQREAPTYMLGMIEAEGLAVRIAHETAAPVVLWAHGAKRSVEVSVRLRYLTGGSTATEAEIDGAWISRQRAALGLSQSGLARITGLSVRTLQG